MLDLKRIPLGAAIGLILTALFLFVAIFAPLISPYPMEQIVGVVVIEVIFVYPGMGQYLVDHVAKRDVPVVQAVGLIFAAVYIGLNIIADVAAIIANPRLRHPK